jgi:hypothetical protein
VLHLARQLAGYRTRPASRSTKPSISKYPTGIPSIHLEGRHRRASSSWLAGLHSYLAMCSRITDLRRCRNGQACMATKRETRRPPRRGESSDRARNLSSASGQSRGFVIAPVTARWTRTAPAAATPTERSSIGRRHLPITDLSFTYIWRIHPVCCDSESLIPALGI